MKKTIIVLIVLVAISMQGCIVKSIHPFFHEKDVVYKEDLEGDWSDQDREKWRIHKNPYKPNSYELHYSKNGREVTFIGHLFYIDDVLYLDLMPTQDNSEDMPIFDAHLVPTHSIAKVTALSKNNVSIQWFNEEWLGNMFNENRIKISHEIVMDENPQSEKDGFYLLTASTDELQKFVKKYGKDENAFDRDLRLQLTK